MGPECQVTVISISSIARGIHEVGKNLLSSRAPLRVWTIEVLGQLAMDPAAFGDPDSDPPPKPYLEMVVETVSCGIADESRQVQQAALTVLCAAMESGAERTVCRHCALYAPADQRARLPAFLYTRYNELADQVPGQTDPTAHGGPGPAAPPPTVFTTHTTHKDSLPGRDPVPRRQRGSAYLAPAAAGRGPRHRGDDATPSSQSGSPGRRRGPGQGQGPSSGPPPIDSPTARSRCGAGAGGESVSPLLGAEVSHSRPSRRLCLSGTSAAMAHGSSCRPYEWEHSDSLLLAAAGRRGQPRTCDPAVAAAQGPVHSHTCDLAGGLSSTRRAGSQAGLGSALGDRGQAGRERGHTACDRPARSIHVPTPVYGLGILDWLFPAHLRE